MMGIGRYLGAVLLVAFAAGAAHAGSNSPMIIADAGKVVSTPRFLSLDSTRRGIPPVRTVPPAMRSDRAMMQAGFMRLDRNTVGGVHRMPVRAVHMASAAPEPVRVISPTSQDSAVLDLFGDANEPLPATTATPKFGRVAHAWPLPSNVAQRFTSGFGHRNDPFNGGKAFHNGVDIAAATGTSVLASADGTVTGVGGGGRIGKFVSVKHSDGTESSYGHLSAQSVRVGQRVRQGQKLGEVGSTGRSTGPHLHYALKRNGEMVNPMTALRQPAGVGTNVASRELNGAGGGSPMIIRVR